ncbi:MAG: hypothetical protein M3414_07375, partial [Pseudomonadota bacterium]|nr:hypothetical protein [Pseudomonadota bacterium]
MRAIATAALTGIALAAMLGACSRAPDSPQAESESEAGDRERQPIVTISSDQAVPKVPEWDAPEVQIEPEAMERFKTLAAEALESGDLYGESDDAIPLYLALRANAPEDEEIQAGLAEAVQALLARGDAALEGIDQDRKSIREAHEVAAVARSIDPDDEDVAAYLARVERTDEAQRANLKGERALNARNLGEEG